MAKVSDVVILGGGVIGLTTAYFLAREGVRVRLLDRGDFGQEASWAGAGILPPGNRKFAKTPFDQLRAHSVAMFPALSAELKERTGIDNGYLCSGGLEFVSHGAAAESEEWRGEGVQVQSLTTHDLAAFEPALGPNVGAALYLPDMAQVRNPWHVRALVAGCRALGVDMHAGQAVQGFVRQGSRIVAAKTEAGDVSAGAFLVAAGAWSDQLLADVGYRLGVHPVRGQIVLLHPEKPILRHILVSGARYLVPRGDGRILVGSTEENVGFDKHTTAKGIQGLLELATFLAPPLADAPVEKSWAGLRPGSTDGFPTIGIVPGMENLYVAAGHFRAGIQLSPGTALMLTEMILGKRPTISGDAFAVRP
jgi:glycine oxidase